MSRWTIVSRTECGSVLTTTMTVSVWPSGPVVRLEKHRIASSSTLCRLRLRSCCSAGCRRRMAFSSVRYGASVRPSASAAAQSRGRSWNFSVSRYSSDPGRSATCSNSSNPAYTPQAGDEVAAIAARILNAPGPPYCR
jgi:hypothetical protein